MRCYSLTQLINDYNKAERASQLVVSMWNNVTTLKSFDVFGLDRRFAFDRSYWSHDGFNVNDKGYLKPENEKYADQVRFIMPVILKR